MVEDVQLEEVGLPEGQWTSELWMGLNPERPESQL